MLWLVVVAACTPAPSPEVSHHPVPASATVATVAPAQASAMPAAPIDGGANARSPTLGLGGVAGPPTLGPDARKVHVQVGSGDDTVDFFADGTVWWQRPACGPTGRVTSIPASKVVELVATARRSNVFVPIGATVREQQMRRSMPVNEGPIGKVVSSSFILVEDGKVDDTRTLCSTPTGTCAARDELTLSFAAATIRGAAGDDPCVARGEAVVTARDNGSLPKEYSTVDMPQLQRTVRACYEGHGDLGVVATFTVIMLASPNGEIASARIDGSHGLSPETKECVLSAAKLRGVGASPTQTTVIIDVSVRPRSGGR